MSKRPRLSHPNNPKIWNGGTWYYCHKYTGGKCDGQYRKNKPSEFQVTMKSKPIHTNTIKGQGGDKSKYDISLPHLYRENEMTTPFIIKKHIYFQDNYNSRVSIYI